MAEPLFMTSQLEGLRKKYAVGTKVPVIVERMTEKNTRCETVETMTVESQYQYHVLLRDERGRHRSERYFALEQMQKAITERAGDVYKMPEVR